MPSPLRPLALLLGLAAVPAGATPLDAILASVERQADPAQAAQLRQAVQASPQLRRQLDDLAARGELEAIDVVADTAMPQVNGHAFAAAVQGRHLVLSEGLLRALQRNRRSDVERAGEVMPDNTVFVLAHLAVHLAARERQASFEQHLRERTAAGLEAAGKAGAATFDGTALAQEALNHSMAIEASGVIAGWNAVADAAQASAGHGQPLQEEDAARLLPALLFNLRYREVFERAMAQPDDQRVRIGAWRIAPDGHNLQSIAQALLDGPMLEIQ
jgi:hypothetical protein